MARGRARSPTARPSREARRATCGSRTERVAAEVCHGLGPSAEAVHAVDAEHYSLRKRLRDRPHREPDAGARVDPGQRDDSRPSRDCAPYAAHDLVLCRSPRCRRRARFVVPRARAPVRLVRRVVVVLRREYLVPRPAARAACRGGRAHRRRVGQRYFGGGHAEKRPAASRAAPLRPSPGPCRYPPGSVSSLRRWRRSLRHGPRMCSEQERGQMDPATV